MEEAEGQVKGSEPFGNGWRRLISQWRWRVAHAAALAVIGIMIAVAFWLSFQLRSLVYADFEREAIRQVRAAVSLPQLLELWQARPDMLQEELGELAILADAQVTALTPQGAL